MTSWARLATVLILGLAAPVAAQRPQAAATRPGWLPRRVTLEAKLTPAERRTALTRLEEVERILLQVPELASPKGFEVMAQFYGGARRLWRRNPGRPDIVESGSVVEYMVRLQFFHPTHAISLGEGCTCIEVRVNPISNRGASEMVDAKGRTIYIESARGEPLPPATAVYGRLSPTPQRSSVTVLLTSGGEIPWDPVTREEYYNAVSFDLEGQDGAKLAELRKSLATTPYLEWLGGAAQRKKEREETLAELAALKPAAEVAKFRKTLEDAEREMTERLRASEASDRERNNDALLASNAPRQAMEAELAAMTAEERRMPALIDATLTEGPNATGWRLTDRDSPTAWRVLTPRHDFWRARASPVEARAIQVSIAAVMTGEIPAVHAALWQAFRKLDWAAFTRLLDPPH